MYFNFINFLLLVNESMGSPKFEKMLDFCFLIHSGPEEEDARKFARLKARRCPK